jgi:hypothetical protein
MTLSRMIYYVLISFSLHCMASGSIILVHNFHLVGEDTSPGARGDSSLDVG